MSARASASLPVFSSFTSMSSAISIMKNGHWFLSYASAAHAPSATLPSVSVSASVTIPARNR